MGQNLDTGQFGGNDKWRRSGIRVAREQVLVIVGHQNPNKEDREDEEENDPDKGRTNRRGNCLPWILRFCGSQADELCSLVGESSLNQRGPEPDEFRRWTVRYQIRREWSRVNPIVKTEIPLLSGTSIDANGEDQESDDSDDLDAGEPELHFTIEVHG